MKNKLPYIAALITVAIYLLSSYRQPTATSRRVIKCPDTLDISGHRIASGDARYLLIDNGWSPKTYEADGGYFSIEPEEMKTAGVYKFSFLDKNKQLAHSQDVYVRPAAPSRTMETYLSYPYLEAGSDETSEIVNITTDLYGNLLDFTPEMQVHFTSSRQTPYTIINSTHSYNTAIFYSQKSQQSIPYTVSNAYAYSAPKTLKIEPSSPATMQLKVRHNNSIADGQSTLELVADEVRDQYGNTCLDGNDIVFCIKSGQTQNFINAVVVRGEAIAQTLVPSDVTSLSVYTLVDNRVGSNTVQLSFDKIAIEASPHVSKDRVDFMLFSSRSKQQIEDGTMVKLTLIGPHNKKLTFDKKTEKGSIQISRKDYNLPAGKYIYTLQTLGNEIKGTISL